MSVPLSVKAGLRLLVQLYKCFAKGLCKSWTLDSGLDCGLDRGLYYGLIFGLDSGPSSASVTTIFYRAYQHTRKIGSVLLTMFSS